MHNPLTMKLEQFTSFSAADRALLDELASARVKTWAAREDIIREGDHVDHIHLVISGLAARAKLMTDGGRQIMAFLIPGDLCDLEVFVLAEMDHAIIAISETTCALIPAKRIRELLTDMEGLTRALWWSTMTDSAVLRERIIDQGQRDARERIAHLFYEMLVRYRIIGRAKDNTFPFPVTQQDLGDALGLTSVHVNRTLQQLRAEGLVELTSRVLTVKNPEALRRVARFDGKYLHLRRTETGDGEVAERAGDLMPPKH